MDYLEEPGTQPVATEPTGELALAAGIEHDDGIRTAFTLVADGLHAAPPRSHL